MLLQWIHLIWHVVFYPIRAIQQWYLLKKVSSQPPPCHVGIIMDGNRRFARSLGLDVKRGHNQGAEKAKEVLEWCLELKIKHVTVWGFSTDNSGRRPEEVAHLYQIFAKQALMLAADPRIHQNKVRLRVIGDVSSFPQETREALQVMQDATASHSNLFLNVALGYGGREEIISATKRLIQDLVEKGTDLKDMAHLVDGEGIRRHLYDPDLPDPDLIIRTSGEVRLSGFLLWQSPYTELYFCRSFWPCFTKTDFLQAIDSFQRRGRRWGK